MRRQIWNSSLLNSQKIKNNKKLCRIHDLGGHAQGPGHCQELMVKTYFCGFFKTAEVNIIKLHRKVKPDEKFVTHDTYIPKSKVLNWGKMSNRVLALVQKKTKPNFLKYQNKYP